MHAMTLSSYIKYFHTKSTRFALYMGVTRQQVQRWKKDGYIVVDGVLYSPRRIVDSSKMTGDSHLQVDIED